MCKSVRRGLGRSRAPAPRREKLVDVVIAIVIADVGRWSPSSSAAKVVDASAVGRFGWSGR
jgi:hypothetical protein